MPILVRGDVTVDNYEFFGPFRPDIEKKLYGTTQERKGSNNVKLIARQLGGAHLLARFAAAALTFWGDEKLDGAAKLRELEPWKAFDEWLQSKQDELLSDARAFDDVLQLSYRLKEFSDKRYRVETGGYEGFTLPMWNNASEGSPGNTRFFDKIEHRGTHDKLLARPNAASDPTVFLINYPRPDASWVKSFSQQSGWFVVKFLESVGQECPLLSKMPLDTTIGIVPADELRKGGLPISRSLSWERTVLDFMAQLQHGRVLPTKTPEHLVITFGYDGALYVRSIPEHNSRRTIKCATLVYSKGEAEGDCAAGIAGDMPGSQSAFVSSFTALLYTHLTQNPELNGDAVKRMLAYPLMVKRRLLRAGFEDVKERLLRELDQPAGRRLTARLYHADGIFSLPADDSELVSEDRVKPDIMEPKEKKELLRGFYDPLKRKPEKLNSDIKDADLAYYELPQSAFEAPADWSLFGEISKKKGLPDYRTYVLCKKGLDEIPICRFGKIQTAELSEIEGFRAIRILLTSYLAAHPSAGKPLGVAVFGMPGSGKGFSVKNIIDTLPTRLRDLVKDDRYECNLTALSDPEDLSHYFQLARNSILRGKVPVLFFDEFDCTVGATQFFWLKHFLAPLQDGEFLSDHVVHPIGRAIFVFAGGVCHKFGVFKERMEQNSKSSSEANVKGTDFISRLVGYVDVAGLSPSRESFKGLTHLAAIKTKVDEPSYLMKRALVLRSVLENQVSRIFPHGPEGDAMIDSNIVDALLQTTDFRHGVRSMEALVRMSFVGDRSTFDISCLPAETQMDLHVDRANFEALLKESIEESTVRRISSG